MARSQIGVDANASAHAGTPGLPEYSSRYLYFVVFCFFLVNLLATMDRSLLTILVEPIRADLALDDNQLGLLSLAFATFYALFGLAIGRLTDTGSRSRLLSISVGVFSAATVACGWAQNFIQLFLARVVVGVGEAGSVPSKYSMIGDYFPPERRASALSLMQAGLGIGPPLGLIVGGILADGIGWRATFWIVGLPGIVVALLIARAVKEPPRARYERSAESRELPSIRETVWTLARNRSFGFIVLAFSATTFAIYGVGYWMPSFLVRSHAIDVSEVGVLYGSTVGVSMVLGLLMGAALASRLLKRDRRWEVWMPGLVNLIIAGTYLVIFTTPSLGVALAFVALTTFCLGLTVGPASAAIQSIVGARMRGVAVSITMLISALLGQGMGPWAIGAISNALSESRGEGSLGAALLLAPVIFVVGGVLYFLGARSFRQDMVD